MIPGELDGFVLAGRNGPELAQLMRRHLKRKAQAVLAMLPRAADEPAVPGTLSGRLGGRLL